MYIGCLDVESESLALTYPPIQYALIGLILLLAGCYDTVLSSVNEPPRINTGGLLLVEGGSWVMLPVAAYDCDGEKLAYRWRQLGGPAINMADTDQPWLRIFAPEVEHKTLARFEVTVTDSSGLSTQAARCVLVLPTGDRAVNDQDQVPPAALEAEAACDLQLQADIN